MYGFNQSFISTATTTSDSSEVKPPQRLMNNVSQRSVYQPGQTPNMMGEAYRPIGKTDFQFKDFLNEGNKVEEVYWFKIICL